MDTLPDNVEVVHDRWVDVAQALPGMVGVTDLLGTGTFTRVYRCTVEDNPEPLALKLVCKGASARLQRGVQIHSEVSHPCLVKMIRVLHGTADSSAWGFLTELCEGGTLKDLIHGDGRECFERVGRPERVRAAVHIAAALDYLHGKEVVHREVKPGNGFLSARIDATRSPCCLPQVKLGDLGLARLMDAEMSKAIGTLGFIAPEVLEGCNYAMPADVFSFGMLLYELLTGDAPYAFLGLTRDVSLIMRVLAGTRPPTEGLGPEATKLLEQCWAADPAERPIAKALMGPLVGLCPIVPAKRPPVKPRRAVPL